MKLRLLPCIVIASLLLLSSLGLNAKPNSSYSLNTAIIDNIEDSILGYLDLNPAKSDSLATELLMQFKGTDIFAEGIANYYRGESAYCFQKWTDAEKFYQQATQCFSLCGDSARIASSCNNLGLVYYYLGQFDKALNAFTQSLSIELYLNNEKGIAQSYQNIAMMLEEVGQVSKAVEFYNKALDLFIELNEWLEAAGVYNNLAAVFAQQSEFEKAESHYLKALDIYNKRNIKSQEAIVLCNIGALMIRKRNFDEGGKMLEKALVLMKINGDKTGEISAYSLLGDLYSSKNEYQQAIFLYKTAIKLALEIGSTDLRLTNMYSLYLGYKNSGLFENALKTHEEYQALRDTFLNENPVFKQGILTQELEKQLSERDLKNSQASIRERAYWIIIISVFLLGGILIYYLIKRRKNAEHQFHLQKFGHKFIQSQMDTHFVFSMLSSLQGHIISGNHELALDHLSNIAVLLRKTFENSGKGLIPLNQEIDFLHAYFKVQNQRFNKEIGINIESNIDPDNTSILVPFMVTKPFIESAITNGLFNDQKNPQFDIAFMHLGEWLKVTIEDNGTSLGNFKNRNLEERLKSTGIPIAKHNIFSLTKRSKQFAISGVKVEDKALKGIGYGTRVSFSFPIVMSIN